jgi:hypothetical protein
MQGNTERATALMERSGAPKVMDGAMTDIQNLGYVDLASWSLLLVQMQKSVTSQSHRKCIVRDTH